MVLGMRVIVGNQNSENEMVNHRFGICVVEMIPDTENIPHAYTAITGHLVLLGRPSSQRLIDVLLMYPAYRTVRIDPAIVSEGTDRVPVPKSNHGRIGRPYSATAGKVQAECLVFDQSFKLMMIRFHDYRRWCSTNRYRQNVALFRQSRYRISVFVENGQPGLDVPPGERLPESRTTLQGRSNTDFPEMNLQRRLNVPLLVKIDDRNVFEPLRSRELSKG